MNKWNLPPSKSRCRMVSPMPGDESDETTFADLVGMKASAGSRFFKLSRRDDTGETVCEELPATQFQQPASTKPDITPPTQVQQPSPRKESPTMSKTAFAAGSDIPAQVQSEVTGSIMTVDDVANSLNTSTLNVNRLIARGDLASVRLGNAGPFRVLSTELTRYVRAGAPDFDPPKLGAGWFDDKDTLKAAGLPDAIMAAVEDMFPDRVTVEQWVASHRRESFDLPIDVSRIRSILTGPAPRGIVLPGQPADRYPSWGQMYLAREWRRLTKSAMGFNASLQNLFSSRQAYRDAIDAGWKLAQRTQISRTKAYSLPRDVVARVSLVLPLSAVANVIGPDSVERLAF